MTRWKFFKFIFFNLFLTLQKHWRFKFIFFIRDSLFLRVRNFLNLCSSNCFLRARNFSNLFFRQNVSFKFIFLFQSDGPEIFQISFLQFSATDKLSCFLYLHILCKNMSFQTQILIRYVYEWSEFFSVIVFDPFSYYLNVNLRWASRFFTQLFFRK